jgi:hypothetical protein
MDTGTIVAQHMAGGCLLNLIDCQDNQASYIYIYIYVSICICMYIYIYILLAYGGRVPAQSHRLPGQPGASRAIYVSSYSYCYICLHTAIYVSSYCYIWRAGACAISSTAMTARRVSWKRSDYYIYVSSYCYVCVLILNTTRRVSWKRSDYCIYVSSYCYICVLILNTTRRVSWKRSDYYIYVCPHTTMYVSSYSIRLCMCPHTHTAIYVCPYTAMYVVLILLCM